MNLKNKIAVVTGGSSGIGRAISVALVQQGCKVVFTYNSSEEGAKETLKLLGKNGIKYKVDLHNEKQIDDLFDLVSKKFGGLDILVNNAGVNRPRDLLTPKFGEKSFRSIYSLQFIVQTGQLNL